MSYGEYVEHLTFLLFLKMADERSRAPLNKPAPIPKGFGRDKLVNLDGPKPESGPDSPFTICDPACGTGGFFLATHN